MKVVVIGCTHAGTTAVQKVLTNYPDAEVTVFERNDNVSFLSCGIALYVGGVIEDKDGLFYADPQGLEAMGATIKMEHNVKMIDTKNKEVYVEAIQSGETFTSSYDKLIFTTGSWPVIPPIHGVHLSNVLLCKNYNQALQLVKKASHAKKVAVIGAGYIGMELVEAFLQRGKQVTLIEKKINVLNHYTEPAISDLLAQRMLSEQVELILNEEVLGLVGNDGGRVASVVTDKGQYEADLVVLCVGLKPSSELLIDKVNMLPNGAIEVDEFMHTSDPDILAGGDTTAIYHNVLQKNVYHPLATNAIRMGALIGENIVENRVRSRGVQSTTALQFLGLHFASSGVTYQLAKENGLNAATSFYQDLYRCEFMPENARLSIALVYEKLTGRILGGQIISDHDLTQVAQTLSMIIQNQMTLEDIAYADFFFQPYYDKPWNYLNLAAQQALSES